METKKETTSNSNVWKIAAIVMGVVLLCSLCFNAILAFIALDRTIRVNELVG
jgi:hypothetical protein